MTRRLTQAVLMLIIVVGVAGIWRAVPTIPPYTNTFFKQVVIGEGTNVCSVPSEWDEKGTLLICNRDGSTTLVVPEVIWTGCGDDHGRMFLPRKSDGLCHVEDAR